MASDDAQRAAAHELFSEANVALRMRLERTRRNMTPARLAARMTEAGAPMNPSAIWKIEKGEPRRKITVDELIAMAKVFGLTVEEMLEPVGDQVMVDALHALRQSYAQGSVLVDELDDLIRVLHRFITISRMASEADDTSIELTADEEEQFNDWVNELTSVAHAIVERAAEVSDCAHALFELDLAKRFWRVRMTPGEMVRLREVSTKQLGVPPGDHSWNASVWARGLPGGPPPPVAPRDTDGEHQEEG